MAQHQDATTDPVLTERRRALLAQLKGLDQARQGVLMELGTIERCLGIGRTVPPRDERRKEQPQ
jgi:hypothetical protein